MIKYEVFDYNVCGNEYDGYEINDVVPTSIIIYTDTSKASICKRLGLDDPYKMDVCFNKYTGVIYVYYNGRPLCELHKVE